MNETDSHASETVLEGSQCLRSGYAALAQVAIMCCHNSVGSVTRIHPAEADRARCKQTAVGVFAMLLRVATRQRQH